jgi:feruloyl esterase
MVYRKMLVAGMLLAGAAGIAFQASPALGEADSSMGDRCELLAGMAMGDVRVTAATFHAEGRELPAGPGGPVMSLPPHCLVEGVINERIGAEGKTYGIGFELALPEDWNGRYLLQGGGGLNGSIRPAVGPVASGGRNALSRGFAVASHDSGHKGAGFDDSFHADQRAALDFAETSVLAVTLATREITADFYGSQPHHSYMTGCSTGGREGMLASQRYPELFDGIVVGAPAMRPGHSNLGIEYAQVMLNRTLPDGVLRAAGLSAAQRAAIHGEVLKQCDAADGLADGTIANVEACRSFDASALQCEAGEGCLSAAEVEALQLAFAGPRDASGRPTYVPIPWDTGITFDGPGLPGYVPSGQPGVFGPANPSREIDIDERMHQVRMDAVGRLTDTAYWTNLSTFLDRGGKMLFFHGVSDPWFSAFDTWEYFQRAGAANGDRWDDAARFYMVPGMMHCSGGNAFQQFDLLGPMVEWVEQDNAPASVPATRLPGDGASMPLCPHPQYAHYDGGPVDEASSYSCRMPES